jgi:WD40 repeat protein/uncharacterized protein with von Willebrand factor type A (vWA) domain
MSAQLVSRWERQNLVNLVEDLRHAGFPVGTSELIDATALLLALRDRALDLDDPTRLRSRLRPVFCKSAEQQQQFDAIFDEWWSRLTLTYRPPTPSASAGRAAQSSDTGRRLTPAWLAAVVVGAIAVIYLVAYAAYTFWPRPPIPPAPPTNVPGPSQSSQSLAGGVPKSGPGNSNRVEADRLLPAVRDNVEIRPRWIWLVGALPLCALVSISLPLLVLSRTRLRRRSEPMFLDLAPLTVEARRLVPPMSSAITDRLARHVRSHGIDIERFARRPTLDIRRTIEATLRNHGIPTLRWSVARVRPSYVVLIDVANERDPRGRLFYQWAERLRREGLDVELLLLRRTVSPRTTGDSATGHAASAESTTAESLRVCPAGLAGRAAEQGMPLTRLRAPAFGERLIVVSDGDPLVDVEGRWRTEALRAGLHRWRDRVLFTPVEPRDWGVREEAIERAERVADPGFIVLPLEESALAAWTDLVLTGQLSTVTLGDPQRFPALLRKGGGRRFVDDEPPAPETLERLIQQLQIYLGNYGFYWLAAIAVTPVVRWELTLLLGKAVLSRLPRLANETSLNESLSRNYRRLARLPWLQRETFPDWLRLRLLLELSDARRRELREVVESLLEKLPPRAVRDGLELDFERPPGTDVDWRDQRPPGTEPPGNRDLLYLGYMSGVSPEQLLLRAPRQWRSWAKQIPLRGARGWRRWLMRARERTRATFARWAWVDGLPYLGINRRRMLVSLTLALPLIGALVVAKQRAPSGPLLASTAFFEERPHPRVVSASSPAAVAFSADGQRIVSVGSDGALQWRDGRTGAPIGAPMPGQLDTNWWRVAFSRDDKLLASADWSVAFSRDGKLLASGASDGSVTVRDTQTGRPIKNLHIGALAFNASAIAFSPDSRTLATGFLGGIELWDAPTGQRISSRKTTRATLITGLNQISTIDFSPNGDRFVSGGEDGQVRLWNARDLTPIGTPLPGQTDSVYSVAFSPDGRRVVSGGADGALRLWDATSGALIGTSTRVAGSINAIVFSGDGNRVVSGGSDGRLRLWDGETGAAIGEPLEGHASDIVRLAISPDGSRIVSAGADDTLRLWEWQVAEPIGEPLKGPTNTADTIAFSPDGQRLATGSLDGTLQLWDAHAYESIGAPLVGHTGSVTSVAFSPDGNRLVSGSSDRTLRLWDIHSGAPALAPLSGHTGSVMSVAFSPDGQRVASAGFDGTVRLWDAWTGTPVGRPLLGHTAPVMSVAFSPDGRHLLSGSEDRTLRQWDVQTGQPVGAPLLGHTEGVLSVAFSRDGRRLVSGSDDGTARLWDARTGAPVAEPLRYSVPVELAVFTADGRRVVSRSSDSTLRVWDGGTGERIGSPLFRSSAMAVSPTGPYVAVRLVSYLAEIQMAGTMKRAQTIREAAQTGNADLRAEAERVKAEASLRAREAASIPKIMQLYRLNLYTPDVKRGAAPTYDALVQLVGNMPRWQPLYWLLGAVLILYIVMAMTLRYREIAALEKSVEKYGSRS